MRGARGRSVAIWIAAALFACSCQAGSQIPKQLAADQTLRLPIYSEPSPGSTSLDPARLSTTVETAIGNNIYDGLYRYDEQMREQPDIAKGMPAISADGLSYTFHLRDDVRFWNGDRVTATDFVYSWNRAAAIQGDYAYIFQPVAGYDSVANKRAGAQLALSAPDPYTLVARLSTPSGYWLAELVLPAAWVVDQKAIVEGGVDAWWTQPQHLLGTGPFRLTNWTQGVELDFAAVANWWGGTTGTLGRVELHLTPQTGVWAGYAAGRFDVVGFGSPALGVTETAQLTALRLDPSRRAEIHTWPFGTTSWVGFNLQTGPFSGYDTGRQLRQAFSQAIDRQKLAQAICQNGTICVAATGGLISKGLAGYLGDGSDPATKFDPAAAKATVKRLDPDGSLLRGLVFYFPIQSIDPTQALAANLIAQWRANLGVDVSSVGLNRGTYFADQTSGRFTMFRLGWEADYDHPQQWFDYLFINSPDCGQQFCNSAGTVYDRPGYSALIASADQKSLAQAVPDYRRAGKMLLDDSAVAILYYLVRTVVIKPYVQGYGANVLWESRWTSVRILQH